MAKLTIKKNSTNLSTYLFIQDSSSTTGAPLTGLTYNSTSLSACYIRPLTSPCSITLSSQTVTGSFVSGGFVETGSSTAPGIYRFDIPDAVSASGVNSAVLMLYGATNMYPVVMEIELTDLDPNTPMTSSSTIADAVWDEVLTGATHNIATSAGKRMRTMDTSVYSGTVVSSTENTIRLDSGAADYDGAYDPAMIYIDDGYGLGQCRNIFQYSGSTRTAVVDRDWKRQPDATSTFVIVANSGREHVNEGLARGGSASTIILNALASSQNNAYKSQIVFIRSGTGEDQARRIDSYNGTTKEAVVQRNWDIIPDITSAYAMLPTGIISDDCIAEAVWDATLSSHELSGTTGSALSISSGMLDTNIDGTYTLEQIFQIMASVLAGKLSGGGTTTLTFRDLSDTLNRVTVTVNNLAERTGVTINV